MKINNKVCPYKYVALRDIVKYLRKVVRHGK